MYIGILLKALFVVAQQVKKSQGPSRRLITSIFMDSNKKPYKNDCTLLRGGKKSRVLDFRALLLQNYSHVWQILVFVIQYFLFFPVKPEWFFYNNVILAHLPYDVLSWKKNTCANNSRYTHGSAQLTNRMGKHLKTLPQMEKLKDLWMLWL